MENLINIMDRKGFILLLLFCFILPSISAITYQEDQAVDIKIPCSYNGTSCDGTATCELTIIQLPDSVFVVENVSMTNGGAGIFNYTTTFNEVGEYQQVTFCCQSGDCASDTELVEVTESGSGNVDMEWILFSILAICYVLIFVGVRYGETPIVVLGCFVLLALSIYTFVNGFGKFGNESLIIQLFSGLNFAIGAYIGLAQLFSDMG